MFIAFLKCFCLERLSADNCYVAVMAEGVAVALSHAVQGALDVDAQVLLLEK